MGKTNKSSFFYSVSLVSIEKTLKFRPLPDPFSSARSFLIARMVRSVGPIARKNIEFIG